MACHLLVVHVTARQALILGDLINNIEGQIIQSIERERDISRVPEAL